MPEEHVKEGDVDWLVGSPVVFNLAQHHLQPEHRAGKECGETVRSMRRGKKAKRDQSTQPFSPNSDGTVGGGEAAQGRMPRSATAATWDPRDRHPLFPVFFSALHLPPDPPHLDAAGQDARGEVAVELGVLLTLGHQVAKLGGQQELSGVLVQDFGEGLSGSQATKHYCIVFMHQSQAVQEACQLLDNLCPEPHG